MSRNFSLLVVFLLFLFVSVLASESLDALFGVSTVKRVEPGHTFVDLTFQIDKILKDNQPNYTEEVQNVLRQEPLVFYSTDALISELSSIVPVINLLNLLHPTHSVQLMVALRYINGSKFIWRRMDDWFNDGLICDSISSEDIHLLNDHIAAFVLDWRLQKYCDYSDQNRDTCGIYSETQGKIFLDGYSISLTNSVKSSLAEIFDWRSSTLSTGIRQNVGVAFTKSQQDQYYNYHRYLGKEVHFADFLLTEVNLNTETNFPLTYAHFKKYLDTVTEKSKNLLPNNLASSPKVAVILKLAPASPNIFDSQVSPYFVEKQNRTKDYNQAFQSITHNLNETTFLKMVAFSKRWAAETGSDVVFGTFLHNASVEQGPLDQFIPHYFRAAKWDPCSVPIFQDFLLSNNYNTFAVNEYTWRMLASLKRHVEDRSDSQNCAQNLMPYSFLRNTNNLTNAHSDSVSVLLFMSRNSATVWDYTSHLLDKLLNKYSTVDKMKLSTIVFNPPLISPFVSRNRPELISAYKERVQNETLTFAKKLAASGYKIGCLVDDEGFGRRENLATSDFMWYSRSRNYYDEDHDSATRESCNAFFNISSVFVWQFTLSPINSYEFALEGFNNDFLKKSLFRLLIAREMFIKKYPGKEVILRFVESESYCPEDGKNGFFDILSSWPVMRSVPMILEPAFDLRNCWDGLYQWRYA